MSAWFIKRHAAKLISIFNEGRLQYLQQNKSPANSSQARGAKGCLIWQCPIRLSSTPLHCSWGIC